MTDMEWNDLAGQSLPSLSSGGDFDSSAAATWKVHRNLSELQHAANQSVWAAPGASGGGSMGNMGQKPSSWKSMASLQQSNANANANAGTGTGSSTNNSNVPPVPGAESLQDMLGRHEQDILNKIIVQTEAETRQRTDQLVERQLQQAWEKERDCWIQELVGTRTLGGAATTPGMAPLQSSSSTGHGHGHTTLSVRPSEAQAWSSAPPSSYNHHSSSIVGTGTREEPSGPVDPRVVQAHLAVVQEELKGEPTPKQLEQAVEKFQKLTDPASGSPMESSYASAWQLVSQLIKVHTHSPVDQAMAALVHFCQQFQMLVVNRVRRGALAHQDMSVPTMYVNDMAGQCAAFCKLTLGATDSPWPVLFYCLRCGDAVAAKEVLSKSAISLTGDAQAALHRIVAVMAQGQRNACCFWEAGPPRVDAHDRQMVADLLERSKNLESTDMHQTGVYALLSGTASYPTSETVLGFSAIEDYLCSCLWKALLHSNPVDELVRLAEVIDQYGPSYFYDAKSYGWSYALPLLATQQYQKALSHLAEAGGATGILQAAHLGLILVSAGVPVGNLGHPEGPDNVVAALLVAYSNKLISDPATGSLAALEYIARIPNKTQARRETAALIAKTGETEKLVGRLNAQGIRENNGALEKHFSPAEISALLGEAADILSREKSDRQKLGSAAMCFMLAGRYADVLSLLNQLLSPPNEPNENRQFWLEQTKSFLSHYIDKRTHVLDVLERDNQLYLIKTSRTMIDLNAFFERLRSDQFEEALSIAESLQLLPASQNDVAAKETAYQGLNIHIKQAYPFFLVGAMQTLYSEHRRIKLDLQAGASPVVRKRLQELQEKARILVTFAGLVGMAREQTESLSRLESLMI
jgi:hypothetical protein